MKSKLYALTAMFSLVATQSFAQYITTTEFPNPHSISNEGLVVGYNEWAGPYYIWDPATNNVETIGGIAPGNNHGGLAQFSLDGKYLSGTSSIETDPTIGEMSRYNTQTKKWERLGYNYDTQEQGSDLSGGYYISGDGNTVVGISYMKALNPEGQEVKRPIAYAWNSIAGTARLETANPKGKQSRANAVSNDGSVIIGWEDMRGPWKAQVWKRNTDGTYQQGKYLLANPNGDPNSEFNQLGEARAISGNGKWIGGKSDAASANAWIWSEETGMIDLGRIAQPEENNVQSWVTSINYDGSVVLGYTISKQWIDSAPVYTPFIWTKEDGLKNFNEYVTNTLKFDLKGDKIYVPTQLSPNEKFITGWSLDEFGPKMFRIQLPQLGTGEIEKTQAPTLYPNPVTNVLNIDAKEQISNVSIYTLTGQQIFTKSMQSKSSKVDMSTYKAGVYIVEVNSNGKTKTYKVIKK